MPPMTDAPMPTDTPQETTGQITCPKCGCTISLCGSEGADAPEAGESPDQTAAPAPEEASPRPQSFQDPRLQWS